MNLVEFNDYLNSFLCKENFLPDPSKNGIQIQNEEPLSKEIKTVAFAVDACEESALIAIQNHADVLVCHHGLFWGIYLWTQIILMEIILVWHIKLV